jgi:hypothetical protein
MTARLPVPYGDPGPTSAPSPVPQPGSLGSGRRHAPDSGCTQAPTGRARSGRSPSRTCGPPGIRGPAPGCSSPATAVGVTQTKSPHEHQSGFRIVSQRPKLSGYYGPPGPATARWSPCWNSKSDPTFRTHFEEEGTPLGEREARGVVLAGTLDPKLFTTFVSKGLDEAFCQLEVGD